ncbi:hypothetical protein ACFYQA_38805 [Streptomyces sp. NPDC005774]|uniref:hypothetical protein n=1 Tax=Streptomyces sp. NPDC005774 TaxID=3364728 RepID=UPI0036C84EED
MGATKEFPNSGRLYGYQPLLAVYGSQAEPAVLTHPNAAYAGVGRFGEVPTAHTTPDGLPVGVMLSGRPSAERTLLELAFELEADEPFRGIRDA